MADWRSHYRWLFVPGRVPALHRSWHLNCTQRGMKCDRLDLGNWNDPTAGKWTIRLDLAIARSDEPVILVTHDVACFAVPWWAALASSERTAQIAAVVFVAPPDLDALHVEARFRPLGRFPCTPLPFPSVIIASADDPDASLAYSESLAERLGASVQNAGPAGRLNGFLRDDRWEHALEELLPPPERQRRAAAG